jgi:hypothetical protein
VRQGGVKHGVDRAGDGIDGCLDSVCSGDFDRIEGPNPSSGGGPGSSEKDDVVESDGDRMVREYCLASVIAELTNGEDQVVVQGREYVGSASQRSEARDGEHACVRALDVGLISKTDGDAGDCWCDRGEIASDFEEVACGSRVDYNWRGGGRSFGIDILANIV